MINILGEILGDYANTHFLLELSPTDISICVDPTYSS